MRVLFLYPNVNLAPRINQGLAALSAFMKRHGHETSLLQFNSKSSLKGLAKIDSIRPDIICMSCCTNQWEIAKYMAEDIKKNHDIKIFAGGIHPTTCPESITETRAIDGICLGEGELPLLELVRRLSGGEPIDNVPSFWMRKGSEIIKNEIHLLVEKLDDLPIPDWSIFDSPSIHDYPSFSFSRGCVYDCQYCVNSALREIYKGKGPYIRMKSVDRAIEEMRDKVDRYDLKILNFDDDTFVKNRNWTIDFCSRYSREISRPFNCNTRPESISEEICAALKAAGGRTLLMGVESGDIEIRRKILRRPMTNGDIEKAFGIAHRAGLKTFSFNMVGIPGETAESFKKTVELNRSIKPDDMQLTLFTPYPGTPLGELCREKGYIRHKPTYGYFHYSVLELPGFPRREIHKCYDRFEYLIYRDRDFLKALRFRISKLLHRHPLIDFMSIPLRKAIRALRILKNR